MIKGSFTWNGQSSDNFSMKMLDQPTFASPQKDLTANSVPGRNGSVLTTNHRMNDVSASFNFHAMITDDFAHTIRRVRNWLMAPDGYQAMTWDGVDDLTYYLYFDGSSLSFQELSATRISVTIGASIFPVAFYTSSLSETQYFTGNVIVNNGFVTSKPKIRLLGTGAGTFVFGSSTIQVQNVTDEIDIDTELGTVTDSDGNSVYSEINTTTYMSLPTLVIGNNTISIPSGWTCYITGRFGEFA